MISLRTPRRDFEPPPRGQGIGAFLIDAATEVANADAVVDLDVVQALRSGFDDIDAGRSLSLAAANLRFVQDLSAARDRQRANI